MPKRVSVTTVKSEVVQGEDSWVKITRPQVKDIVDIQKRYAGKEDDATANIEAGKELIRQQVIDWNWVDDNDAPLPNPRQDPDIVERLTDLEMRFLFDQFKLGTNETTKN